MKRLKNEANLNLMGRTGYLKCHWSLCVCVVVVGVGVDLD